MPLTASCQGSVMKGSKPAPLSAAAPAISPTMCQVTGESSRSSHLCVQKKKFRGSVIKLFFRCVAICNST